MRVLLVNKHYYLRSGTERYLFNLARLLARHGHAVEAFAMQDPRNAPATYAEAFVPPLDFQALPVAARPGAALRVLWSRDAARRMARVLDAFQPDVVHALNLYHHLSPSVLPPATRRGVPVVQTLNDYKLVCPNYLLYTEGGPCTRCRDRRYSQAVRHRCLHGSLAWSALAAVEMTLHKRLRVYERHVARFIAPTHFVRRTAETFGIPPAQLVVLPYFLFPEDYPEAPVADDGYAAYVGRLVEGKGLPTLLRAMARAPAARLLVVGEGPLRPALEREVAARGLTNVRFTGYLAGDALRQALAGARFTVLPSEWYEVFGQSLVESLAVGRPAIGARIGGIPEALAEGEDGLLFPPGDAEALAGCIRRLWDDPAEARAMGRRGRARVARAFGPEAHGTALEALYRGLAGPSR
jgi:glycosyltransferase involved in cell wall biosynthesis